MMTDPFRAELTAEYIVRENHSWAAQARLARSVRPPASLSALLASLASRIFGEAAPQVSPELQVLARRERPAA